MTTKKKEVKHQIMLTVSADIFDKLEDLVYSRKINKYKDEIKTRQDVIRRILERELQKTNPLG